MTTIKIVPKEHWEILKEYLDSDGVTLIPESIVSQLPDEKQETLREMDGDTVDYDFGGEADILAETVLSPNHYFLDQLFEEMDEDDEEEESIE